MSENQQEAIYRAGYKSKLRDIVGTTQEEEKPILRKIQQAENKKFAQEFKVLYEKVLLFDERSINKDGVKTYDKDDIYLTEKAEAEVIKYLAKKGIIYSGKEHSKHGGFEYSISENGSELAVGFRDLREVYEYIYEEVLGFKLTGKSKKISRRIRTAFD